MFLGIHGGSGSTEKTWGTSDVKYIPFVLELLAYSMYKDIKSALKLQTDGEEEGKFCLSNFPLLRKIGIWFRFGAPAMPLNRFTWRRASAR